MSEFHGSVVKLRELSGAQAVRVIHMSAQQIGEHSHDWPLLTLVRMGSLHETFEGGEARIEGPAAIFHPAGSAHSDEISEWGLETLSIVFDPAWINGRLTDFDRSRAWIGGRMAREADRLARSWGKPDIPSETLRLSLSRFFSEAFAAAPPPPAPPWAASVSAMLSDDSPPRVGELARRLHLHPGSVNRAWRAAFGQGLAETARRRRVARAAKRLRFSTDGLAEIAAAAGFCDQSHMNRLFQRYLGRTPAAVRQEMKPLGSRCSEVRG